MNMKRAVTGVAIAATLGAGGAAIAVATGGGDDDASEKPITGDALQKASDAAVEEAGGGSVTDTEVGDEEGFYEVEVTRGDESQVDVHLNRDFSIVGSEDDDDSREDEG